jgi:hypothetical protein
MEPREFRKRPVVVEAIRWIDNDLDVIDTIEGWMGRKLTTGPGRPGTAFLTNENGTLVLNISTLEGVMKAQPGDWVIKGVVGEFYPCRHDIFMQTYEPNVPSGWGEVT